MSHHKKIRKTMYISISLSLKTRRETMTFSCEKLNQDLGHYTQNISIM